MTIVREFALYDIAFVDDVVTSLSEAPFPREAYSRYKYGAGSIGARFGHSLAQGVRKHLPDLLRVDTLMVTCSPYKYVPTGSLSIAEGLIDTINYWRMREGIAVATMTKIERTTIYSGDYGKFPVEERERIMGLNGLKLNEAFLRGSDLLVIDDIKITGAHQSCIMQHADAVGLRSVNFFYVVGISDTTKAKKDAGIEDRINHTCIHGLDDVFDVITRSDFRMNARVCKYILDPQRREELPRFLQRIGDSLLMSLFTCSIGDEYGNMDSYKESFLLIEQTMRDRHLIIGDCLTQSQTLIEE